MRRDAGPVFALGAAFLYGTTTPFAKRLLGLGLGEVALAGLLYTGAAVGLLAITAARRTRAAAPLGRADTPWIAAAATFGGFAAPVLLTLGLARASGMGASLLLSLEMPFTAVLALVFLHERLTRRALAGIALVLSGSVALALRGQESAVSPVGAIALAGSALCWAIDNTVTTKISSRDALHVAAWKCGLAAPLTLAVAAITRDALAPSAALVGQALGLGVIGYGISLVLYVRGLRALGAARTGALFATAPFLAALTSIPVLHEQPTLTIAAAGGLMAAGTVLLATGA